MKFYILMTLKEEGEGTRIIYWKTHMFMCKKAAFEEALKHEGTCVLELSQTASWNHQQILEEKD